MRCCGAVQVVKSEVLGKGTFGTTYKGMWRGGPVALKVVRVATPSELTTFLREVEAMSLVSAHAIIRTNKLATSGCAVSPLVLIPVLVMCLFQGVPSDGAEQTLCS